MNKQTYDLLFLEDSSVPAEKLKVHLLNVATGFASYSWYWEKNGEKC